MCYIRRIERVELIARYIAPPWLSPILYTHCIPVELTLPLNVSVLLEFDAIAPPCIAELLLKLLIPVKLDEMLDTAEIATPLLAKLFKKWFVPVNLVEHFFAVAVAPP